MGNSSSVIQYVSGNNCGEISSTNAIDTNYFDMTIYASYGKFLEIEKQKYDEYLLEMANKNGVNAWCGVIV